MRIRYIFFLIMLVSLVSCAQTKIITNAYAFQAVRMPGNIPVGVDGRPLKHGPDTVLVVFVELKSDSLPVWTNAWKGGKKYTIVATQVTVPVIVGKNKYTSEEINLSAEKGSRLLQLQLTADDEIPSAPEQTNENQILLQGIYKGKKITHKINSVVELWTPESL